MWSLEKPELLLKLSLDGGLDCEASRLCPFAR